MTEFALIFRNEPTPNFKPSPEQMQQIMGEWKTWFETIGANGQIVNMGSRLSSEGRTVNANNSITVGPYAEIKEIITGYIVVRAENIDSATEIAKGCPILKVGGNVEVRTTIGM